jgi:hypothetical protein
MAHIDWSAGGEADVLTCDDDRIELSSTASAAPGSRPEGTLTDGRVVRLKVQRCRREDSLGAERFRIEGRLLDASRALREHLRGLPTT